MRPCCLLEQTLLQQKSIFTPHSYYKTVSLATGSSLVPQSDSPIQMDRCYRKGTKNKKTQKWQMSLRWNFIVPPPLVYLFMKLDKESRLEAVWSRNFVFNGTADLWGHPESTDTTAKQRRSSLSSPGVRREKHVFITAAEFSTGHHIVGNSSTSGRFNTGSA